MHGPPRSRLTLTRLSHRHRWSSSAACTIPPKAPSRASLSCARSFRRAPLTGRSSSWPRGRRWAGGRAGCQSESAYLAGDWARMERRECLPEFRSQERADRREVDPSAVNDSVAIRLRRCPSQHSWPRRTTTARPDTTVCDAGSRSCDVIDRALSIDTRAHTRLAPLGGIAPTPPRSAQPRPAIHRPFVLTATWPDVHHLRLTTGSHKGKTLWGGP